MTKPRGPVCWCGHGVGKHGGRNMLSYCLTDWCMCYSQGGYQDRTTMTPDALASLAPHIGRVHEPHGSGPAR